jgi:hypothetical protein
VLYGIAVVGDIAGVAIDEPAEVVASACLAGGLVVITAATLRRELRLGRAPSVRAEARSRALSGAPPAAPR